MRIKTILIIIATVLFTVMLMQNTGRDHLDFLWATFWMSKLVMLLIVAVIAFILGYFIGRPKKVKRLGDNLTDDESERGNTNTLSDEDKEYIS